MKKFMNAALAFALLAAGCSASSTVPAGTNEAASSDAASEDLYFVYGTDVKSLDYVTSMSHSDIEINENLVDGLTETDRYGNYIPCLAESYEKNEDATEWTFKLRQGVKWVTNSGEHYADVKADDFVAGLQHATEFGSQMLPLVQGLIVGLDDYANGRTQDFSTVGVEAVDDYTVVYHLTKPCTYFDTMAAFGILLPVNREFLEAQGEGCKLGAPDKQACSFGDAGDLSRILYNGAYIFTANDAKSKQVLVKNPNYWDEEHVYINKMTFIYIDGSDPSATVTGFEQPENPYCAASLLTSSDKFEEYLEQYKDIRFTGEQDTSTFGTTFNLNRVNYNHTYKQTDKQKEDTKKAILNKNFRLAFKFAHDRVAEVSSVVDETIARNAIRNTEIPYAFVKTSDGVPYGDLVSQASEFDFDLHEGQDPFTNKELVKKHLDLAKEELPEVEWPIHLDLMIDETIKSGVARVTSIAQSVKDNSDGDIIIDLSYVDADTFANSAYFSTGPRDADWDISVSTGWGPDYMDPMTYLHIFSPVDGETVSSTMGIDLLEVGSAENNKVIEQVGLLKYQELLEEADAIVDDNDARYRKFAEAEALLLDNALFLPGTTLLGSVNWRISRVEPFQAGYGLDKKKHAKIRKEPISSEEYAKLRAEWKKVREGQ